MNEKPKIIGINTRYYPAQATVLGHKMILCDGELMDQSDNPPSTVAVLVAGDNNDYACYIGHGDPEWVARHGDKISFLEACFHFPGNQLSKEHYRI